VALTKCYSQPKDPIIIGIPIYEKVDLLDVAAPYEIFSLIKEFDKKLKPTVYLIAAKPGIIKTRDGFMMKPHKVFSEVPRLDVLWVPGGDPAALKKLMNDPARTYLNFLITRSRKARLVTSVCEGALLLAQAGLLDGYNATTHWAFIPCLKKFPAIKVVEGYPRFVVDRNRVTGGGISSGLDEALRVVELLSSSEVAQQIQQRTQYYPCPPVASTIPDTQVCPLDQLPSS
jgi:transcriptional regulator GlxA family with amidase domain